jgi:hypothetical protein
MLAWRCRLPGSYKTYSLQQRPQFTKMHWHVLSTPHLPYSKACSAPATRLRTKPKPPHTIPTTIYSPDETLHNPPPTALNSNPFPSPHASKHTPTTSLSASLPQHHAPLTPALTKRNSQPDHHPLKHALRHPPSLPHLFRFNTFVSNLPTDLPAAIVRQDILDI